MKTELRSIVDEYEVPISTSNQVTSIRVYNNFASIVFEDGSITEIHMDYDNLYVIDDE